MVLYRYDGSKVYNKTLHYSLLVLKRNIKRCRFLL